MKKKITVSKKTRSVAPKPLLESKAIAPVIDEAGLIADLRGLIQTARQRVATVGNSAQVLVYWHVGQRLLKENLHDSRAAYGKKILATVSQQLCTEFGEGFTLRALYRAIKFFQLFPEKAIVSTLSTQLSWSHFIEILSLKDPLAREFYAEMCRIERWDVRTLRKKIGGMLFQRTALSKNIVEVKGTAITILSQTDKDYISLTDIARFKDSERSDYIIQNWLRTRTTVEYLGIWERLNNPGFNSIEFDGIRNQAGLNSFVLTAKRWIDAANAIGLISSTGRDGKIENAIIKAAATWMEKKGNSFL